MVAYVYTCSDIYHKTLSPVYLLSLDSSLLGNRDSMLLTRGFPINVRWMNEWMNELELFKLFKYYGDQIWTEISKKLGEEKTSKHLRQEKDWEIDMNGINFQQPSTCKILGKWSMRIEGYSVHCNINGEYPVEWNWVHLYTGNVPKLSPTWRPSTTSYNIMQNR